MPPRKQPAPVDDREGLPTTDHMDRLCAAYERIADEITAIRKAVDRFYDNLDWALANADELCDVPSLLARMREPREHDPPPAGPAETQGDLFS